MRHQVNFFLNGRRRSVAGPSAFASLTEYLRDDLGLVGTKQGCAEGDCGACTVLVGRPVGGKIRYLPLTSCILTPCQVDAAHVVTIEGVRPAGVDLTPIQAAMVEHHGSQCGYCTPGFVMALTGRFEADPTPDANSLRTALTGNLCRCTGYLPILDAGASVARSGSYRPIAAQYPDASLLADLTDLAADSLQVEAPGGRIFARPSSAAEAVAVRAAHPGAVIIGGGTDLGVWRNRGGFDPPQLLSLAGVPDWAGVHLDGGEMIIGATATWAEVEAFARRDAPALMDMTGHFAAPQIRHVATFLGNIAGGSPIADAVACLHVLGARLDLASVRGVRTVAVADFATGYRATVLKPDEIIARLVVRLPEPEEKLGLYKVSKRKEMDISTFRAAILVRVEDDQIREARLAFAGVGPQVLRLRATEAFLQGQPATETTFGAAGRHARAEIEPISDLRGSRDFRLLLAENVLVKFYREHLAAEPGRPARVG